MTIWRFQVTPRKSEDDPAGRRMAGTLADFGVTPLQRVEASRLYLIELGHDESEPPRIARELLTDPVVESCTITREGNRVPMSAAGADFEVFPRPGVMDNVALSTAKALADMGIQAASVRTGTRYTIFPPPSVAFTSKIPRLLANDCIEEVFVGAKPITQPPSPPSYAFDLRHVAIRDLDEDGLRRLSREGHLFLSPDEMQAIQAYYRRLERDPTDLEIETLAQTWSEHCVHKTLKSAYAYRGASMPGAKGGGERRYENLLADTIARATKELMTEGRGPECLSVFVDNAGVIGFDEDYGVAFKVETHNHPSAIEPYGGAATGVGGVIRDVLGCGLGARPVANTDVFCVAPPDWPVDDVPESVIHPKSVLRGIVSGVRDYGNCMGIPTVNGAVHFDPRYLGNPLVYCGCVGLIPRNRLDKAPRPGDAIVVLGGRTGRDGIHGATFSSAELTTGHGDEFGHAVQIGNPIEEKKVRDLVLLARDYVDTDQSGDRDRDAASNDRRSSRCLFSAITDCGAGGLSSAIGEMAESCGAEVDLDKVPLKYSGLRYDEIWISEAQERMVLAVPPENVKPLLALAASEVVEATVVGRFTDSGRLVVRYDNTTVGELDLQFLHGGIPKREKIAEWHPSKQPLPAASRETTPRAICEHVKATLADPIVASKHWIVRQYDHEVQAGSVVKPLVGPGDGPSDAAVIRPRLDSPRGVVVGCGLAPEIGDIDPYWMAVAAIDEAVRNCVCVGGDPANMAILDNFCWPSSDDSHSLGALVRTCQACYDAAKTYGLPFISGKDSLNNVFAMNESDSSRVRRVIGDRYGAYVSRVDEQFRRQPGKLGIPYTLLISAISVIADVNRCIRAFVPGTIGRDVPLVLAAVEFPSWGAVDLRQTASLHRIVANAIARGDVLAAHDISDGGLYVAAAEMAIASDCSVECRPDNATEAIVRFGYLLALNPASDAARLGAELTKLSDGRHTQFGRLFRDGTTNRFRVTAQNQTTADVSMTELRAAWRSSLNW